MAETAKSEQPQTNGLENGLDEDERSKMRPADIDADVKEMERRKRVEMIMSSKLFREELERIIELQLKDGNGPAGLLQQISDMMGIQSGKLHTTHMFRGSNCVTPINDIRGVESMGYEKGEKNLRCKLASVFRLMDLYGWSQGINNQITARLNQDEEHFLVNPHGMLFNEITASSLVKVDMQGNIVEPGTTNFSVNTQGFLLHSAIHASRPDVNCVIHIKTPSVLAVSSLKCGLLPICQEALVIGEVSQHPFVSGIFEPEEREKIIRNLGPHNKVLLLHNHGAVCCGATVEEAFYNVYNTVLACETQMKLMPIGVENLLLVSDETRKQVYDAAHRAPDAGTSDKKKFRVGEMEFEALIRMLDNAGFRTGYIYRHPLVKGELPKPKNDVEVPPAVSSLGYLIEQEELYKQGNWKKCVDGKNRLGRTKWLNSPNVYQKVEILETGTSDPKKITKWVDQNSEEWVAESSPTHSSTPVKIDSALQFVPKGTNPKEFKKLQQQIKENRRADKITSGPQSHILEGVSWEEAKKLQDANITQTGDQVILVGAASKGIIQRNYQHNALVYKTPYAKNPFDSMSDKEIEDYKQLVERKQRGDTDYEESQSESEAISSSRQDAIRHFKSPLLSPQSATSETEEESRDEPRVLRIETKTAPRPIQAEVVLSDGESDTTDARVERSHSARYPKAEKPESVTLMNSFRKSWSLKREKDKSKDVDNYYDSRNLKECELNRTESLHCYIARVKQLTHKPIIVDMGMKSLRPLLKSASDPCNLSTLNDENVTEVDNRQPGVSQLVNTSLSCGNIINTSELQQRLNVRKKLLHTAKMKFLGYHNSKKDNEVDDKNSKSPMRVLISEIRETINEIMSPERSKTSEDSDFDSVKWYNRSKFVSRSNDSYDDIRSKASMNKLTSFEPPVRSSSETFTNFKNEFSVLKMDLENRERSDTSNCNCVIHGGNLLEKALEENENQPQGVNNITDIVKFANGSDDDATYTITDDSLLPTYSFTESTETEWYYSKTIMKLENSQTVLEIKECENKEEGNLEVPVKYIDTGIDTDFTSEKDVEIQPVEEQKEPEVDTTQDVENDAPVCESSGLNKSSETDSSFLKSSSGRTSNDVDTSFAFKTETENSEKTSDKSPEKSSNPSQSLDEKKNFLKEMLLKTKETIQEESSDSEEGNRIPEKTNVQPEVSSKLGKILESPEFTNIDTEDAPVTSSSKDTSPEVVCNAEQLTEDEPKEPEAKIAEKENVKAEHKRKKNVKSATKITVKKELKEKDSNEPVVSEIRLTIKNMKKCQSEKYEVKIQDVTNTSEDLSRSVSSAGENVDGYESFEIVDKSCDCEAQQNLEELQGEVSSTIEKLHTIENYFEDEIKKHSNFSPKKGNDRSEEFTIEYNYREFEEVLNESRSKMAVLGKDSENFGKESAEFFVSSPLGNICGEIEVCDDGDEFEKLEGGNNQGGTEDHIAMSSAFVAAILSEAILGVGEQEREKLTQEEAQVEVICNVEELPEVGEVIPPGEEVSEHQEVQEYQVVEEFEGETYPQSGFDFGIDEHQEVDEVYQQQQEETFNQGIKSEDCQPNYDLKTDKQVDDRLEIQKNQTEQEEINNHASNHIVEEETECQDGQPNFVEHLEEVDEHQSPTKDNHASNHIVEEETECQDGQPNFGEHLEEVDEHQPPTKDNNISNHVVEEETECQDGQPNFGVHIEELDEHQPPTKDNNISNHVVEEETECQDGQPIFVEHLEEVDEHQPTSDMQGIEMIQSEQFEDEITYQECQQGSYEHLEEANFEQEEAVDYWSKESQSEHPEDETTYQSCQSMFDLEKCEQLEESVVDFCNETQNEQPEDEKTYQDCQPSFNLEKYEPPEEIDAQSQVPEPTDLQQDGVDDCWKQETEGEQSKNETSCQPSFDFEKEEQLEVHQQECQEEEEETGNENPCQDCQPVSNLEDVKESFEQPLVEEVIEKNQLLNEVEDELQDPPEVLQTGSETQNCQNLKERTTEAQNKDTSIFQLPFFQPPLKAITYEPKPEETPVDDILTNIINTVVEKTNKNSTINDVINFIVTNEESPTDSLTEFEDIENIISTSSLVVADIIDIIESQMEGDEDTKNLKEEENKRKQKKEDMFKVTIATPDKKEIFINYSLDRSSTFNTTSDLDQIEQLSNSYIKTDDVNEDFENLNCVESSGKNSLNGSFRSVEEDLPKEGERFCCVGCETNLKSPRSLAIIQEVDEGDSSASSEVAAS